MRPAASIQRITPAIYRVPTDVPESDGTYEWTATTMVLVEAEAGGHTGIGDTYADGVAAAFITSVLAPVVLGLDAMDVRRTWTAMARASTATMPSTSAACSTRAQSTCCRPI